MSSKQFTLAGYNMTAALDAAAVKFTTGTALKCLLQLAPVVGGEITAWGCSFDGNTAATPGQIELCEVDVAASGGTGSFLPVSYVTTAITATTTTSLLTNSQLQPTGGPTIFEIAVLPQPGLSAAMERMLVTAVTGTGPYTYTVVRGINNTAPLASIPVNSCVYAVPNGGAIGDLSPVGSMPNGDGTWATCALGSPWLGSAPTSALTGFNFSTYPSTNKYFRSFDTEQIPPTAPYVLQNPPERGWQFSAGRFVQIRCTLGAAVNVMPWIQFQV